jgi:hypothetical protein
MGKNALLYRESPDSRLQNLSLKLRLYRQSSREVSARRDEIPLEKKSEFIPYTPLILITPFISITKIKVQTVYDEQNGIPSNKQARTRPQIAMEHLRRPG